MELDFLKQVRQHIIQNKWRISYHALKRLDERNIGLQDLLGALSKSEIIEEYPEDQRGSSCLLLCETLDGKRIHVVCSIDDEDYLVIITAYWPEQSKWIDERKRRRKADE
jgi:hypothetical protein